MDGEKQSPNATIEEAAKFLRVTTRTLTNFQERGLLTVVYMGKNRYFRWAELEELAKTGTRK